MSVSRYSPRQEFRRLLWLAHKIMPLPNLKLDATTKLVVAGISNEFARLGCPHTELTKVWYPNVADQSGLSLDSIKAGVKRLERMHAILKEIRFEQEGNQQRKRVWLAFTPEFLTQPERLLVDQPETGHGGKRIRRHKGCGGEVVWLCKKCGQIDIPEEEIVYEAVEEEPEVTSDELRRMDTLIEHSEAFYDAADIPDDVADEIGASEVLRLAPQDVARYLAQPVERRAGLSDEDIALLDEARQGLYTRNEWRKE